MRGKELFRIAFKELSLLCNIDIKNLSMLKTLEMLSLIACSMFIPLFSLKNSRPAAGLEAVVN
jgi:hypothetical protein